MKANSMLMSFLVLSTLSLSCQRLSETYLDIDTKSPQKTYRVVLEGRGDPPDFLSTVQHVKLKVLKGNTVLFSDDKFYREEVDHLFQHEYPVREWLSDSVLRFGKDDSTQLPGEKLIIVNNAGERIDVVKIQYNIVNEKILIFDLDLNATAELRFVLNSEQGTEVNPVVIYTAFSNGRSFSGVIKEWQRKDGSESLVGEIRKS